MYYSLLILLCAGTFVSSRHASIDRNYDVVNYDYGDDCKGRHEVFSQCPPTCEPTCLDPNPFCDKRCDTPRCVCKSGYIRVNKGGRCVPRSSCDQMTFYERQDIAAGCYGQYEQFDPCGRECQPNCIYPDGVYPLSIACSTACFPSCVCAEGTIRLSDDNFSKCIPISDCPGIHYRLFKYRG